VFWKEYAGSFGCSVFRQPPLPHQDPASSFFFLRCSRANTQKKKKQIAASHSSLANPSPVNMTSLLQNTNVDDLGLPVWMALFASTSAGLDVIVDLRTTSVLSSKHAEVTRELALALRLAHIERHRSVPATFPYQAYVDSLSETDPSKLAALASSLPTVDWWNGACLELLARVSSLRLQVLAQELISQLQCNDCSTYKAFLMALLKQLRVSSQAEICDQLVTAIQDLVISPAKDPENRKKYVDLALKVSSELKLDSPPGCFQELEQRLCPQPPQVVQFVFMTDDLQDTTPSQSTDSNTIINSNNGNTFDDSVQATPSAVIEPLPATASSTTDESATDSEVASINLQGSLANQSSPDTTLLSTTSSTATPSQQLPTADQPASSTPTPQDQGQVSALEPSIPKTLASGSRTVCPNLCLNLGLETFSTILHAGSLDLAHLPHTLFFLIINLGVELPAAVNPQVTVIFASPSHEGDAEILAPANAGSSLTSVSWVDSGSLSPGGGTTANVLSTPAHSTKASRVHTQSSIDSDGEFVSCFENVRSCYPAYAFSLSCLHVACRLPKSHHA
jgi:hypothetical protein